MAGTGNTLGKLYGQSGESSKSAEESNPPVAHDVKPNASMQKLLNRDNEPFYKSAWDYFKGIFNKVVNGIDCEAKYIADKFKEGFNKIASGDPVGGIISLDEIIPAVQIGEHVFKNTNDVVEFGKGLLKGAGNTPSDLVNLLAFLGHLSLPAKIIQSQLDHHAVDLWKAGDYVAANNAANIAQKFENFGHVDDLFTLNNDAQKAGSLAFNVATLFVPGAGEAKVASLIEKTAAAAKAEDALVALKKVGASESEIAAAEKEVDVAKEAAEKSATEAQAANGTKDSEKASPKESEKSANESGAQVKGGGRPEKPGPSPRKACPGAGTPGSVGFALGDETFTHTDFVLPGVVPIVWARTYHSNFEAHDEQGPLGARWTTPYHAAFEAKGGRLAYHDASARTLSYPALKPGQPYHDAIESCLLTLDSDNRIRLVRDETMTETYERHGARFVLVRIEDRSGNAVRLTWTDSRLARIEVAGAVAAMAYDHAGRVLSIALVDDTGAASRTLARYRYDEAGDLVEAADQDAASRSYAYTHHLVTRYTDRTGRGMNLEWDSTHLDAKVMREWADDGTFDTHLTWHDRQRLTSVTDALGNATEQYYDGDGYVTRIVYPDQTGEWFFRDAAKNVTCHVFPDGTQESFAWDAQGHLTSHTQRDGRTTCYVYDPHGNLTLLRDPEGHYWRQHHDSKGRVTETLDPLGQVTKYEYDDAGQLVAMTDAKGGTIRIAWRPDGQMASRTDCSGKTTTWKYDGHGRLIEKTHATGETTHYGYQGGLVASVTRASGQRDTYVVDPEGRLIAHVDGMNRATRYSYTAAGLLARRTRAGGDAIDYTWNRLGQIETLRNGNRQLYRFGYDPVGRLISETDFDGHETRYFRDAASGLVTHRLAGGIMLAFDYDATGRLAGRRGWPAQVNGQGEALLAPQGDVHVESESFRYDGLGRLVQADNAQACVRRVYDPVGNLSREHVIVPIDGHDHEFVWRHEHDELGVRIATTRPDGRRLDWLTYGSGHVHGLLLDGKPVIHFERDDAHRETLRELGNGLRQVTQYDAAGRLARQTLQGSGGPLVARHYQYDAAGQLTRIADMRRGEIQYTYDPVGRLTRAQSSRGVETFAYDPADNIVDALLHNGHGGGSRAGAPLLDNLVKTYAGTHFAYDERGNLTARTHNGERTEFGWNSLGRMVTAVNRGMQVTYAYDALGRRIMKRTEPQVSDTESGSDWRDAERQRLTQERDYGLTLYGWDGDTLAYETSWEKRETTHYVYEPGSFTPLLQATGPAILHPNGMPPPAELAYYHCDQIGTPQELTDEVGEVAWRAWYRAWGEAREVLSDSARKAGIASPLRFAGQYYDPETGLHYNRHRYYDPGIGRFISKDPIGLMGGINLYQYVPNPTQWIDPLGLAPTWKVAKNSPIPFKIAKACFTNRDPANGLDDSSRNDHTALKIGRNANVKMINDSSDPLPPESINLSSLIFNEFPTGLYSTKGKATESCIECTERLVSVSAGGNWDLAKQANPQVDAVRKFGDKEQTLNITTEDLIEEKWAAVKIKGVSNYFSGKNFPKIGQGIGFLRKVPEMDEESNMHFMAIVGNVTDDSGTVAGVIATDISEVSATLGQPTSNFNLGYFTSIEDMRGEYTDDKYYSVLVRPHSEPDSGPSSSKRFRPSN